MASAYTLEFEKPLLELERQIDDLQRLGAERGIDVGLMTRGGARIESIVSHVDDELMNAGCSAAIARSTRCAPVTAPGWS